MTRSFLRWAGVFLAVFPIFPAQALDCSRTAGDLPDPRRAAGTSDAANPVEHIVVMMQENHSFDNYFGRLAAGAYQGQVDGLDPAFFNPGHDGKPVQSWHQDRVCLANPDHSWTGSHDAWDAGRNDGFVDASYEDDSTNGTRVMSYYDDRDLPYYYALANAYAIGDRYFSPVLAPTYPNRMYLFGASSWGNVSNQLDWGRHATIFDRLDDAGVRWKYYFGNLPSVGALPAVLTAHLSHFARGNAYEKDIAAGRLPPVAFVDPDFSTESEESPQNIQIGEASVAGRIGALMKSPAWPTTAIFLTYDEAGGFFDHVPPAEACIPDRIAPMLGHGDVPAKFDHTGFRVPFTVISPFARRHFVSHRVHDHTAILKYIETKFNLPALTRRDANAGDLSEFFDYAHPDPALPALPEATVDAAKAEACGDGASGDRVVSEI